MTAVTAAGKKLAKKYYKKTLNLLKEFGGKIQLSTTPTPHIFIGNGGMLCERTREELLSLFQVHGHVTDLLLIPNKSFSFVSYMSTESATNAVDKLSGYVIDHEPNKAGTAIPLYLFYLQSSVTGDIIPSDECYPIEGKYNLIDGLVVEENIIDEEYEQSLWEFFRVDANEHDSMKNRRVQHFGFEFLYGTNNIDRSKPLDRGIPEICKPLLQNLLARNVIKKMPDQLTVNQYQPGQGIPAHVDTHSAFEDGILSISLGHRVAMDFSNPEGQKRSILLPRRSALLMSDESRYLWSHRIVPRSHDIFYTRDQADEDKDYYLTSAERGVRLSLTFRKILYEPCRCSYPIKCDSQKPTDESKSLFLPKSDADAANLEGQHVYDVYEEIADHFSDTRHTPWPRIKKFLCELRDGSLIADIGCGNGKYLGVNPNVVALGSDRSANLLGICEKRGFEVLVSDILTLPYKSCTFDATICIAVIHHLSTKERRLEAIKELVRITCREGLILISVWALEQNEKDITKSNCKTESQVDKEMSESCRIEVSEGRNVFQQQDLLIPWHLKKEEKDTVNSERVFHRFYHVFIEGELEGLCKGLGNVDILESYFDKGNWCVILKRK